MVFTFAFFFFNLGPSQESWGAVYPSRACRSGILVTFELMIEWSAQDYFIPPKCSLNSVQTLTLLLPHIHSLSFLLCHSFSTHRLGLSFFSLHQNCSYQGHSGQPSLHPVDTRSESYLFGHLSKSGTADLFLLENPALMWCYFVFSFISGKSLPLVSSPFNIFIGVVSDLLSYDLFHITHIHSLGDLIHFSAANGYCLWLIPR